MLEGTVGPHFGHPNSVSFFTNVTRIPAKNCWRPRVYWAGTVFAFLKNEHARFFTIAQTILTVKLTIWGKFDEENQNVVFS
jgi:hypothetical protein